MSEGLSIDRIGILRFDPLFRKVRWGGTKLGDFKNAVLPSGSIGESWEISGLSGHETCVSDGLLKGMSVSQLLEKYGEFILGKNLYKKFGNFFPLLIKFIDADDDLSVQVHPDDECAPDGLGKTELWYIIKAESGSYIYSGFNRPVSRDRLLESLGQNKLVNLLAKHFSTPGDVFYIPAGRIHSIGAGNLLLEIQQTSSTTYRLHDYNRHQEDGSFRELHIENALEVIDYSPTDFGLARPQMLINCETRIKTTPFFTVTAAQVMNELRLEVAELHSPRVIVSIEGTGVITDSFGNTAKIRRGQTLLIPAATEYVDIVATSTPLKIITIFIE